MSNPHSQAEPNASLPAKATLPTTPSGKSPRKGPRRATAPAGAPSKAASITPPLLVVGADGMVIPASPESGVSPSSTDDAGHSPNAAPRPPHEGATPDKSAVDGDDAPDASTGETVTADEAVAASDAETEEADATHAADESAPVSSENEEPASDNSGKDAPTEPSEGADNEATDNGASTPAASTGETITADEAVAASDAETEEADATDAVDEAAPVSSENEEPASDNSSKDTPTEPSEVADIEATDDGASTPDDASGDAEPSPEQSSIEDADKASPDAAEDPAPAAAVSETAPESSTSDTNEAPPSDDKSDDAPVVPADGEDPDDSADSESTSHDTEASKEAASTKLENEEAPTEPASVADSEATELAEKSDTAATDESADTADEVDSEPAPMSRRERRMAEQKLGSEAGPADVLAATRTTDAVKEAATAPLSDASSARSKVDPHNGSEEKKRKRPFSFLKGFFFMVVIAAVVVGTGTVLSGKDDPTLKQSQTELNRQAAWERTSSLATQGAALATSATAPKVLEALDHITTDLSAQALALGDGLPHEESASNSPTSSAPATLSDFVVALNASGGELLSSALTADQAMGRVFAAAGTSQLLQAQNLSTAAGSTSPSSAFLPVRVDFAAPKGPECKSVLEPRPGVTIDSALRAAALGEQEAVYAYQVATTRLSEPQFSTSAGLLARHQTKLKVLNEELKVRCLPQTEATAGYALDAQFTTAPAPALAALEADLTRLYADLAALSSAPAVETTDAPAPPAVAEGKSSANPTELRKISVSWLLDSASTEVLWGGSISALSGLPTS
ncbi:hypothetical protein CVS30_15475 [Arthrobacter psychrolactophilus]|uniref:DUF4439 domain-containing protein n=1 Tax=Arthrobacter psychrolactophilus TaxID=92442 RepID=A0A2V5ITE8_9MICC|nr:DUF4439 domain-containing protein [Arthrobacter psychrolactophilus]PYI37423.1 hypothetical protein CVS30_15475 [Arthrobacter psychrolactophilus]